MDTLRPDSGESGSGEHQEVMGRLSDEARDHRGGGDVWRQPSDTGLGEDV